MQSSLEIDTAFLKSIRGNLKIAELTTTFIAFVCFTTAADSPYIAATIMEFCITLGFLLLYILKFNKRFTYFFWPLIDVINSSFAAVFTFILSTIVISTYSAKGSLGGGIVGLMAASLWTADAILLFKKITFNQPRTSTKSAT